MKKPVYDQVKQALQDFLALEPQAIKAEIKRLDAQVDGLKNELLAAVRRVEGRMERLAGKTQARFGALDEKVESLRHEVRTALEIRERLAALEGRLGVTCPQILQWQAVPYKRPAFPVGAGEGIPPPGVFHGRHFLWACGGRLRAPLRGEGPEGGRFPGLGPMLFPVFLPEAKASFLNSHRKNPVNARLNY